MPMFQYKGFDGKSGSARKGVIEADSMRAARVKLKQRDGILVSELKEEASLGKNKVSTSGKVTAGAKVKTQDLAVMTRQFSVLQKAHVPLDETLRALTAQVENPILRQTLADLKDQISEGKSLADALGTYPSIFNKLYVNMVRAGESSGTLGLVFERLADFIEYEVKIKGQAMSAAAYPSIMILAGAGIITFLFVGVVPKLQKVFISLKVKLPWYTKLLIAFSEFLQQRWYVVVIGIFAVIYFFKRWKASEKGRHRFDHFLLHAPIVSGLVLRINVSRFTKTLSTLLSSGVPIINALEITKNTIANTLIANVVENAKIAVQEGQSLAASIDKSRLFPPLVSHMIMTGERTGQLEEMLGHVSDAYDSEVERKVDAIISLIEPLMIILMALGAVVIIIALFVPMMSIMSQIK